MEETLMEPTIRRLSAEIKERIYGHKRDGHDFRQLLLTGGHGVGKTYYAEKLAIALTENENRGIDENLKDTGQWSLVTLHPTYGYEDLVRGITVRTDRGIIYELKDRVFARLVKIAKANPSNIHVIILDDIGRADLNAVLGELLYALEYRNREITLKDGQTLLIPDNLVLIATYNTAVRYEKPMDYALLSRFHMIEIPDVIEPDYIVPPEIEEIFSEKYLSQHALENKPLYLPGRGYYSKEEKSAKLKVRYMLAPLLRQYLRDGVFRDRTVITEKINGLEEKNAVAFTEDLDSILDDRIEVLNSNHKNLFKEIFDWVEQIRSNRLMSNAMFADTVFFNKEVKHVKSDENMSAHLLVKASDMRLFRHQRNDVKLNLYGKIVYAINDTPYAMFSHYSHESSRLLNSRNNSVIRTHDRPHRVASQIVIAYYTRYMKLLDDYIQFLQERSRDQDVRDVTRLRHYAEYELKAFQENFKHASDSEPNTKLKGKNWREIKAEIEKLQILKSAAGSIIQDHEGNDITVRGVYTMTDHYMEIMDRLEVRQMILYGPPGTSKTYSAQKLIAEQIFGRDLEESDWEDKLDAYKLPKKIDPEMKFDKEAYWDIVQFHPSYSYEDFVRGITVKTHAGSPPDYVTVNMALGRIAAAAEQAREQAARGEGGNPPKFFLIIDEINRANMANVFGELIYALEYRGKKVSTPYEVEGKNDLTIPDNLYIIGTMNTADKSIGGMDYAIRRRFLFFPCLPDAKVIVANNGEESGAFKLYQEIAKLFDPKTGYLADDYYPDDVQIGHTYFLVKGDLVKLKYRFFYQMIPILHEYYKDGVLVNRGQGGGNQQVEASLQSELFRLVQNPKLDQAEAERIFEKIIRGPKDHHDEQ